MSAHAKRSKHPHLAELGDIAALILGTLLEWFDDLTTTERVAAITKGFIWLVLGIAAVTAIAACGPDDGTSTTTNPTAVKIVTGMADHR